MKTVWQTLQDGLLAGTTVADESPLEPGVYLIPAGCVEVPPPDTDPGYFARWVGGEWTVDAEPKITTAQRNKDGSILVIIDGEEVTVLDDMGDPNRIKLARWEADGNVIDAYVEPPPTKDNVNAERDRRTEAGIPFAVRGKLHFFDFNQMGKDNITGAATLAKFAILKGAQPGDYRWANPDTDFTWITQANEKVLMDAHETSALGDVAAGWTTKHIYIARAIKDMDPIPADYADDKYWS